jgi:hypothetical protein
VNELRAELDRNGRLRVVNRMDSPADAPARFQTDHAQTGALQFHGGGKTGNAGTNHNDIGFFHDSLETSPAADSRGAGPLIYFNVPLVKDGITRIVNERLYLFGSAYAGLVSGRCVPAQFSFPLASHLIS